MFKKLLSSLLLSCFLVPTVFATQSKTFDQDTFESFFFFDEGTWWDYVKYISYSEAAGIDPSDTADSIEDATSRLVASDCKYDNCQTLSEEDTGDSTSYVISEGELYLRMFDGSSIEMTKVMDVDDFSGDADAVFEKISGVKDGVDTELSCEFTDEGDIEVGGYTADVVENFCVLTIDFDNTIYGDEEDLHIVTSDYYMENIGNIYTEMKYYSGETWLYTIATELVDTSIDLIDLSSDGSDSAASSVKNPFSDLGETHDNYDAIIYLYGEGMINGYGDGTFKPNNTLNRAELLKILVEGSGETPSVDQYHDCFSDVTTDWYAPYVCYAKEQGWVSGYPDGSFKPGDAVNKVEALKMLLNSQGVTINTPSDAPFSDVPATEWFAPYVAEAKSLDILEEDSENFQPDADRTRGGICENLYRLLLSLEQ